MGLCGRREERVRRTRAGLGRQSQVVDFQYPIFLLEIWFESAETGSILRILLKASLSAHATRLFAVVLRGDLLYNRHPGFLLLIDEGERLIRRHRPRVIAERREFLFELRIVEDFGEIGADLGDDRRRRADRSRFVTMSLRSPPLAGFSH